MGEACFLASKDFIIGKHLCISVGGRSRSPSENSRTPLKDYHRASPGELDLLTPVQKNLVYEKC